MKTRTAADIKNLYRKSINNAFDLLATDIRIVIRTTLNPSVSYDEVFNEPIDSSQDAYYDTNKTIKAIVRWNDSANLRRLPGGTVFTEEVYLTCKANDVFTNPADPTSPTVFEGAKEIIVDGVSCKLKNTPRRSGIQDFYTIFVVLERTT